MSLVFLLITGGGWAYIEFLQKPELERLQGEVTEKRTELSNKQQIANQYDMLAEQYENAQYYIKNYDKGLYFSSNEDKVFDFINQLNSGPAVTDFSFTFVDSTSQGQFGIINMQISGSGFYRNVVNFIRRIELSKPINKIANLNISPINNLESYGRVNFNFALASYYSRSSIVDATELTISNSILESVYNPFYPFIREIEPNEENLIDIESSSLVALSSNAVFVIDQNGSMQKLQVGDRVYLGRLETVNIQQQSAIFELNKGGIIEHVTLEVQQ